MSDFKPNSHPMSQQDLKPFGLSTDALHKLDPDISWVSLFQQGQLEEAYAHLREDGPLPEMTAHIRADPDQPDNLPLRQLQYMIAWTARDHDLTGVSVPEIASGHSIAVVGGGPAGLAATVRLLESGHIVNLYEREDRLGGAPALVYEQARLSDPADEIDALLQPALRAGRLTIQLHARPSSTASLESYDAVLLATGCWREPSLGQADGVWSALRFLKAVRTSQCTAVPEHVVLLCGGDAAMDAAVAARTLGARQLTLLFACPRNNAHWHLPDAWFDTPGVSPRFNVRATGYQRTPNGAVSAVTLENNDPLETSMVIEAMALSADPIDILHDQLFTAGAIVNGGASVQQCMREALDVANAINRHLHQS